MASSERSNPLPLSGDAPRSVATSAKKVIKRIKSQDLLERTNEMEIDHEGRIYRLRLTRLNKLILTA